MRYGTFYAHDKTKRRRGMEKKEAKRIGRGGDVVRKTPDRAVTPTGGVAPVLYKSRARGETTRTKTENDRKRNSNINIRTVEWGGEIK